jgi:hypothetical protein
LILGAHSKDVNQKSILPNYGMSLVILFKKQTGKKDILEMPGIEPGAFHMLYIFIEQNNMVQTYDEVNNSGQMQISGTNW